MSEYHAEARLLDAEILEAIRARRVRDFDDLALRIFAHQLRYNEPYARYCERRGVTPERMPPSWRAIPPVPAAAYKEAALCTFDPAAAALTFETSGTTRGTAGKHYMESAALYDAALLAGFGDRFARDGAQRFHFLLLVPDAAEQPRSSLGYMMKRVAQEFGVSTHSYVHDGAVAAGAFVHDAAALGSGEPVFVAATAFALVHLLDAIAACGRERLPLPPGSFVMETGGFKGRSRTVARDELYERVSSVFGVPPARIVSEYGMTELSSQYYDAAHGARQSVILSSAPKVRLIEERLKSGPAWLRSYAIDERGNVLPNGVVGALVHVDLANRSSCVAVQTEDIGAVFDDGIALFGRYEGAELRGCSLDAESLRAVRA